MNQLQTIQEQRMQDKAKQIVRSKRVKRSDIDRNVWVVKSSNPDRLDICYIVSFDESEDRFVCTCPYFENRYELCCKHILSACFLEGSLV